MNFLIRLPQFKNLLFVITLLAFAGCSEKNKRPEQLGNKIIQYLTLSDYEKLKSIYYEKPLYEYILKEFQIEGDELAEEKARSIRLQLYESFQNRMKSLSPLASLVKYEVSRTYESDSIPHVVISLEKEGIINFVDFELTRREGRLFIRDFYDFKFGEYFSKDFIDNELPRTLNYSSSNAAQRKALADLGKVEQYMNGDEFQKAWIAFNQIDYQFQWNKRFQRAKLGVTKHLSDSLYQHAFADMINAYTEERNFRIAKEFQYYYEFGDTANALLTLDSLSILVGESFATRKLRANLAKK